MINNNNRLLDNLNQHILNIFENNTLADCKITYIFPEEVEPNDYCLSGNNLFNLLSDCSFDEIYYYKYEIDESSFFIKKKEYYIYFDYSINKESKIIYSKSYDKILKSQEIPSNIFYKIEK